MLQRASRTTDNLAVNGDVGSVIYVFSMLSLITTTTKKTNEAKQITNSLNKYVKPWFRRS